MTAPVTASQATHTACEWAATTSGRGRSRTWSAKMATCSANGRWVSVRSYGAPVRIGQRARPCGWPSPGPA
ncbi:MULTISPECIES: hypothetical protein [unclassified Micromonospora]|uniref:hypothetical protein n=1 Tax=unclassified Micromonospora TaxID=2617518 RepID=UPI003A8A4F2A